MRTVSLALATILALAASPLRAQAKPVDPPADKPAEKKSPLVTAGSEGFLIQSTAGDYKVQIRGLLQFDGRFFPGDDDKTAINTFLVRRARPILQAAVGKYFEFNLTPDFGAGAVVIQDAYFDVKGGAALRVRLGKFKPPIGLEHLQSDPTLPFAERAYPSIVNPNRDVGFQVSGDLAKGVVSYAAGVFNGSPDAGSADLDTNDSKDVVGRLVLSPFKATKSFLKELALGIGAGTGKQSGPLPAYRSGGQISIVSLVTGAAADGTRNRIAPELSFYAGPFGLGAEYAKSESKVRKTATAPVADFVVSAWQTTVIFAVTGEAETYGGIKVKKPFDPAQGQWGSLELAARVNGIEFGDETVRSGLIDPTKSVTQALAWAFGVNWSLNRNLKQLLSYERTTFTRGAGLTGDRRPENAIIFRSQINF